MSIQIESINVSAWNSMSSKPSITLGIQASPWGNLVISQLGNALCGLSIENITHPEAIQKARLLWPGADIVYDEESTAHWVDVVVQYLSGRELESEIKLLLVGTVFQLSVWSALMEIPFGELVSYKDMAKRVGRPSAFRAVGSAIGRNKVAILVPCHRVIQSSGDLGGYAWGLPVKRALLDEERKGVGELKFLSWNDVRN